MMAMLWAQQIMLGKKTFAQVPRLLKDKVRASMPFTTKGGPANGKQKEQPAQALVAEDETPQSES